MSVSASSGERGVRWVEDVLRLPADTQVDGKALLLMPGEWERYDPFLQCAEDWFHHPGGFGAHPHRGFETVTVVLDGQLEHADSRGNRGVVSAGEVQWMTAGSGVLRSELPHGASRVHTLQLWLNLPPEKKMTEPRYQDLHVSAIPVHKSGGVLTRVISGQQKGLTGPAQNHVSTLVLEVRALAGSAWAIDVPGGYAGFVYLLAGEGRFGADATRASDGQVVWMTSAEEGARFSIRAETALQLFVAAAPPIRAPVVAEGPFVMNTREQVLEAMQDYLAGKFGSLPTAQA
jgi:redox-sensitive bicupin YhaK (pirin superfamily)